MQDHGLDPEKYRDFVEELVMWKRQLWGFYSRESSSTRMYTNIWEEKKEDFLYKEQQ